MNSIDSNRIMNDKKHYCGLTGFSLNNIRFRSKTLEFQLDAAGEGRSFYFTHKGRCGLGRLCRHWNLKPGDEALVPSYNCGSEIDQFYSNGLKTLFYRIKSDTTIDIEDIFNKVTDKTKGIYVTHFFGWPQDIDALVKFCNTKKIKLIEDCALSLYSNNDRHPIGKLGDAAIYSLPKTLPVPDGGILSIKGDNLSVMNTPLPPVKEIIKEMLPLVKRSVLRFTDRIGLFTMLPQNLIQSRDSDKREVIMSSYGLPQIPEVYYFDKNIENLTASRFSQFIALKTDVNAVIRQRRENYIRLYDSIKSYNYIKPLFSNIPAGVCPLSMPVLVEKPHEICQKLNERGILAVQWWAGFHKHFSWDDFPESRFLKEHVLVLPVHQQLNGKDMDYIAYQLGSLGTE